MFLQTTSEELSLWSACIFILHMEIFDDSLVDNDRESDAEDSDESEVTTSPAEIVLEILSSRSPVLDELVLVRLLALYPGKIKEASKSMKPSILTAYAFELASSFNKFYEKCPVLTASPISLINARLNLVQATSHVLENVLDLLGIPVPPEM